LKKVPKERNYQFFGEKNHPDRMSGEWRMISGDAQSDHSGGAEAGAGAGARGDGGVAGAHHRQGQGARLAAAARPADDARRRWPRDGSLHLWYHGSVITHIDSLCHYSFENKIYNGFDRSKIADGPGCPQNGVENQKEAIITHGILVDLPLMKKVPPCDATTLGNLELNLLQGRHPDFV
jgi:hypothetical protein